MLNIDQLKYDYYVKSFYNEIDGIYCDCLNYRFRKSRIVKLYINEINVGYQNTNNCLILYHSNCLMCNKLFNSYKKLVKENFNLNLV